MICSGGAAECYDVVAEVKVEVSGLVESGEGGTDEGVCRTGRGLRVPWIIPRRRGARL